MRRVSAPGRGAKSMPTATPTKKARRAALMTPNTATSSLAALGREALESVLLDLRVQQTSVDAEHFCRLGTITASVLQRLHDQILFELGTDFLKNDRSAETSSFSSSRSPASWSPNGSSRLVMICPRERTTARSTTFSSSRTLPGQSYSVSRFSASSLIAAGCAVAL